MSGKLPSEILTINKSKKLSVDDIFKLIYEIIEQNIQGTVLQINIHICHIRTRTGFMIHKQEKF